MSSEPVLPDPTDQPPFRRAVFYIPGFDPRGAKRYWALYKTESRKQAKITGGAITVANPVETKRSLRFAIEASWGSERVHTDYALLRWDDLVAAQMHSALPWRILRGLRAYASQFVSGAVPRMLRLAATPVIVTLFPLIFFFGFALLGALIGWALAMIAGGLGAPLAPQALIGVGGFAAFLKLTEWLDRYSFTYYLLDFYALMTEYAGGRAPDVQARVRDFADEIREAARSGRSGRYDEVLVIGHSGGTFLAAAALGQAVEADPDLGSGQTSVALLTLGQTMSALGQISGSEGHWDECAAVARSKDLFWLDVASKADGACYALVDPLAQSSRRLPSEERRAGPLVLSARFRETMAPEQFAALRRRYFRLHFQYLYAFERPEEYDYFAFTAGPLRLSDRFAGRANNRRVPPLARELERAR
ncbi:MAG: hypothetical protein MRY63_05415 [Neomegalonema sp.]|nr:hypothetical protein [Neomegalonema sp.]